MSELYQRSLGIIKENQQRKLNGGFNEIPFGFPRLEEYIPGIQRKNLTIVTASSGIGKSKFAKLAYCIRPVEFLLTHPDSGINLKIFYFPFEESKENFMHSIMVNQLWKQYNSRVAIKHLKSIGPNRIVENTTIENVERLSPWFERFEDMVTVVDKVKHPYGIYCTVRDYMLQHGRWHKKAVTIDGQQNEVNDWFEHTTPNHYVIVVIDHISLIHAEKGTTLHESIGKLSATYSVSLRDDYGCSVVIVQQQSAEKEKQQYTYKGHSIESKLEPSLDGLANNKETQRDADEILGLFAPDRYEISKYRNYDINQLQDNFRSLQILKSRDGEANIRVGMFFDGAVGSFEELPKATDMKQPHYTEYIHRVGRLLPLNIV